MPSYSSPTLPDFDVLLMLYQHDKESFETLRRQLLQDAINAAPAERRPSLERLLAHIEATRASASTPHQAACQAFEMMGESLLELRQSWHQAILALSELQSRLLIERIR
jgi:hypothetical protein